MKKSIKLVIFAIVLALSVVVFAFASFAEEQADTGTAFTVYGKDGNPTGVSGATFKELCDAAPTLADGDTVVLNDNMMASGELFFGSTADSPRVINIDLNGKRMHTTIKITPALISSGSYTTINVYSSVAGAEICCTDTVKTNVSGNVFNVRGNSAVINVGDFTKGDVTYPGENLATYSAALIDIVTDDDFDACDENCRFNVNGGSYYSIHSDYSGYIIPRGGKIVMNITDANIISMESKAPINSVGTNTVLNMTNCRIFQYESQPIPLFNSALGTVNMENCITSYTLKSSQSAMDNGILHLKGKNVFAIAAEGDYYSALLADGANKADVKTYGDFELARGGKTLKYYDSSANFSKVLTAEVPTLTYPGMLVEQEDVVRYKFVKAKNSVFQNWSKHEKPVAPYELPVGGEKGVYKYGWQKSVSSDGVIVYKMGFVADYNLKISAVYENGEVYFKILVPAAVVDGNHIDFVKTLIHGESYPEDYWEPVTVGDQKYYYATSGVISPENADEVIRVSLPCEYGSGVNVETTWSFTLKQYIEAVLATEAEGVWSAEQYNTVKEIQAAYFSQADEVPGA